MSSKKLLTDPYNIIITGVGGQGNVIASRIVANMLVQKGYYVTIGESFGATQRGGTVMSHLRVSEESYWSPQIPKGDAHIVVALEPVEAIRMLMDYGNPDIKVLSNTRPIYPVGVIAGDLDYPSLDKIIETAKELSKETCFIEATDEAVKLGNPILGNVIMLGALSAITELPLEKDNFKEVISWSIPSSKLEMNLEAYELGTKLVKH